MGSTLFLWIADSSENPPKNFMVFTFNGQAHGQLEQMIADEGFKTIFPLGNCGNLLGLCQISLVLELAADETLIDVFLYVARLWFLFEANVGLVSQIVYSKTQY